jgi:EAL domain-containing protein (putative c-di-GMP-specific phosphodiesterase class I)
MALYRAKERGRNRHEFFSQELQDELESNKRIADDILRGIEQAEFIPYYQPLVDARTHAPVGVEALVRWQHPTDGLLTPSRFLKVAEDLNVLPAIDRDILSAAINDLERWQSQGLPIQSVSVNVSFRRLSDEDLVPSLRKLDIRPGTVSFEFLESIFLDEFDDRVAWNIDAIKEMGIGIDVDDFGTGHTSVVSLLRLMPRRFKIDRQLIEPVATNEGQRRLVASIVDIGRTLGIKVVAEGVETMEQARILGDIGCDFLQGYAFARPMPAEDLEQWLRGNLTRAARSR